MNPQIKVVGTLKWQRCAEQTTGSSGSRFRNMYMRVFSISANSSGLSIAQHKSHTSRRSNLLIVEIKFCIPIEISFTLTVKCCQG